MVSSQLAGNSTPPSAWGSDTLNADTTYGFKFSVAVDGWLGAVAWYRPTVSYGGPGALAVFDAANTAAPIYTAPAVPDDGAVGWQTAVLITTVPLIAGHAYLVCSTWASGQHLPNMTYSTPPADFSFDAAPCRYVQTSGLAFPSTTGSTQAWPAMDVEWMDTDPGGSGGASGASLSGIDSLLTQHLSANDETNLHHTEAPWLDHAILASDTFGLAVLKTAVDAIKDKTDALPASVNAVLGAVLDTLVADAETAAADRAAMIARLNSAGGGSGFGTVVDDVLGPLAPVIAAYATPAPATWVSQGSVDFDTNALFLTPADAYSITFSDNGAGVVGTVIGTLDVVYRLAWWAISDGERTRERRFIDFPSAVVWDEGRRMPGIALHSPVGASGTIEAWVIA